MDDTSASTQDGSVPVPDPTALTTAALDREVENLDDKLATAVGSLSGELQTAIEHRAQLTDVRFETVDLQFRLIENARIEQKTDTKRAVDDALIAQKEANAKSELVMTAATGELRATVAAASESDRRAANDMKDRVSVVEGRLNALGGNPLQERVVSIEGERRGGKDNTAAILAGIAALVGVIAIVLAVVTMFAK